MSVAAPPPRIRSIAPLAPQMPRRQSCDRCHEQKVRCFTDPNDSMFGPRGSVDSDAGLGGQHAPSSPCVRCKKAGAMCIYSPGAENVEKLVRLIQVTNTSALPVAALDRRAMTPLLSPVAITPHGDHNSHNNTNGLERQHHHPVSEQWLMSSFGVDGATFSNNMGQLSPYSQPTSTPAVPFFSTPTTAPAADNVMPEYSWMYSDPSDTYPEELAEINLRIHRAARTLPPMNRSLPSLSSPSVNEIFDAACSLINVVGRYTTTRSMSLQKRPENALGIHVHPNQEGANFEQPPMAMSIAVHSAMDTSVCLVVLACYQGLLGVFEEICTSFLHYTEDSHNPTSPRTASASTFASSSTTQVVVMVNLISHLLNQLHRAVGSLAGSLALPTARRLEQAAMSMPALSPTSSWSDHSEIGDDVLNLPGEYEAPSFHFNGHDRQSDKRQKTTAILFDQMEQRQLTVRAQVKLIKRLIRQSNVL
ncbi:hypothetical protein B0T26DRAFT_751026 [Lasiosphaeria miniovina]|uniref:Zn(2)-C6 fungal-type domain-containing protein n=1 Tax=Lasiosphaeria miniovina TaxID=1954250 RepID=A0AA40AJ81_9PEZI|nr:uncharacterized protein B0T26DRAFT_751026 [Lasiosphaeria miniovina]KAK0716881.1 hypothetical protein B0T26DRAFT_751026 [Lasiosphaeria miniovina]